MNTELEQRLRRALRDLAEDTPVRPPPAAALRARARSRGAAGAGWAGVLSPALSAPVLAAAAVLLLVLLVSIVPGRVAVDAPVATGPHDRPVLPERFAAPSWRTASVTAAPPGPAIAVFSLDQQLVVVGADGRSYRTLAQSQLYEASHGRGYTASDVILSPEGTQLSGQGGYTLDLSTGTGQWFPVLSGDTVDSWAGVPLLAWSPVANQLLYSGVDSLALVDRDTGQVRMVPQSEAELAGPVDGQRAAFAPDGSAFAVSTRGDEDGESQLLIFDSAGELLRELDLPRWHQLAGHGSSWSPDGRLLALEDTSPQAQLRSRVVISFVTASGDGEPPAPVAYDVPADSLGGPTWPEMLGWRSPEALLVRRPSADGPTEIVELPLGGGQARVVSRLPDGNGRVLTSLHLATALLPAAEIGPAGAPRHGPLPTPVRVGLAVAGGALLVLVASIIVAAITWRVRTGGSRGRAR